jgi:hypothetical protein
LGKANSGGYYQVNQKNSESFLYGSGGSHFLPQEK